ncbi:ABC transporter ATP-binding protein [Streptomyces sp. NPDC050617]|uniref:ABC transporter ATP-binding protein n=1 Tax=Streptomyces sp. NPDC050617 TaxID=3154628 RepID=UPI0034464575
MPMPIGDDDRPTPTGGDEPKPAADQPARTATNRAADRLLLEAVRHSPGRTAAIGLLTTAAAGSSLALPLVLGRALDAVLAGGHGPRTTHWIVACAALIGLSVLLDAVEELLTGTANARGTAWARGRLLRHVLHTGPRAADRFGPGDLVSRLVGNAAYAGTAPANIAAALAAVVPPVGGIVALVLIDVWAAAAFLLGMPLLAALLRVFIRDTTDSIAQYQRGQGEIAGRLMEAIGGAATIAAARTAGRERARILEPLPELGRQGHRMWRVQGRSSARAVMVVPLLQIAVLAVAGLRLAAGQLSVGELLAVSRYAVLASGIGVIVGRLNALVHARTAARRLAEVLTEPATEYGRRRLPPGPGTLELAGVTALRGGREVLRDVDLVVPGGTSMALVGRSGTGKSVLAAVAGRLTEADAGTVTLDGEPLTGLDRDALRGAVGYAFERPAPLGGTIGGTIGFGARDPGAERVREAARAACADDFVRLLPDGYDTRLTDAPLSGGEAQRLGLARAFTHQGRLLVLDDATSSLDTVTELRVADALLGSIGPRTRLIVAHRATTAARADRVAWLEDGRVRAVGRHEELWRLEGYRAVFDAGRPDRADDGERDRVPHE